MPDSDYIAGRARRLTQLTFPSVAGFKSQ